MVDGITSRGAIRVDHGPDRRVYPSRMRALTDIRRARLRELIAEQAEGNASAFGRMIGKSRAQMGFWTAEPDKPGAKNLSHTTARALERQFSKPVGWMDTDPDAAQASQPARPDMDTIVGTVTLLSHYLELVGLPPEEIRDPVLLETAYEVAAEFGKPVSANNVLDLTKVLARRIRGGEGDGEKQQQVRGTRSASGG